MQLLLHDQHFCKQFHQNHCTAIALSLFVIPANIYLSKVSNRNTRKRCSNKVNSRHQNNVNDVVMMSILLTLNIFTAFYSVSNFNLEQAKVCWDISMDL